MAGKSENQNDKNIDKEEYSIWDLILNPEKGIQGIFNILEDKKTASHTPTKKTTTGLGLAFSLDVFQQQLAALKTAPESACERIDVFIDKNGQEFPVNIVASSPDIIGILQENMRDIIAFEKEELSYISTIDLSYKPDQYYVVLLAKDLYLKDAQTIISFPAEAKIGEKFKNLKDDYGLS